MKTWYDILVFLDSIHLVFSTCSTCSVACDQHDIAAVVFIRSRLRLLETK